MTSYIDKGYPVDVIYLDFSKAFDTVPHRRLISKLTAHGIIGKTNRWIESWLTDRRQRVCISGAESDWQKVISGVPQGSILGPVLFVIFINDTYSTVVSSLLKFADDTKTFRLVPEVLLEDLHSMYKWSQDWQLLFNFTKYKCMHIGYNNPNYDCFMGDERIESIDIEKDPGVRIHKSLKVKEQVNYIVKKANRILGTIRDKLGPTQTKA